MARAQAAAIAANSPPRCLAGFSCDVYLEAAASSDVTVQIALRCGSCKGNVFRLFGFPSVAPDPSPYFGIAAGETLYRPPHRVECVHCKEVREIFDARVHGYDGVLNGGCTYESGTRGEGSIPGEHQVLVSFTYNIELEELSELAEEANVGVADLFDWIEIKGSPVDIGEPVTWAYECA